MQGTKLLKRVTDLVSVTPPVHFNTSGCRKFEKTQWTVLYVFCGERLLFLKVCLILHLHCSSQGWQLYLLTELSRLATLTFTAALYEIYLPFDFLSAEQCYTEQSAFFTRHFFAIELWRTQNHDKLQIIHAVCCWRLSCLQLHVFYTTFARQIVAE